MILLLGTIVKVRLVVFEIMTHDYVEARILSQIFFVKIIIKFFPYLYELKYITDCMKIL